MSETSSNATATATRLPPSFSQKRIDVTFTVTGGALGPKSGDADRVTLSGYRCQVEVTNAGMKSGAALSLRIENLPVTMMNRLSILNAPIQPSNSNAVGFSRNNVTIQAGDEQTGMATIFSGTIAEAFADFSGAPNTAFQVLAYTDIAAQIAKIAPMSYAGPVKAATVFSQIADAMGIGFMNFGVKDTLSTYYGYGTAQQQVERLAASIRCIYAFEGPQGTGGTQSSGMLKVWSRRQDDNIVQQIPRVDHRSGLIGYPAYSQRGVTFTTLFDPRIQFWQPVHLVSQYLPQAWVNNQNGQIGQMPSTGTWLPSLVTHTLDSEIPSGRWFTRVEAMRYDVAPQLVAKS